MKKMIVLLVALVVTGVGRASASSVLYDITFNTPENGSLLPASGSFDYDASLADPFSNFVVVWDNRTFDLTASANNPSSQIAQNLDCGTGSGGQYVFSFLTTCPTAIYYGVSSAASGNIPGFASFNFAAPAPAVGIGEEGLIGASFDSADDNNYVKGTFEVSAAPAVTPEPGSLVLMMSGMLALAGCAWRRSALRGVLPTAR